MLSQHTMTAMQAHLRKQRLIVDDIPGDLDQAIASLESKEGALDPQEAKDASMDLEGGQLTPSLLEEYQVLRGFLVDLGMDIAEYRDILGGLNGLVTDETELARSIQKECRDGVVVNDIISKVSVHDKNFILIPPF